MAKDRKAGGSNKSMRNTFRVESFDDELPDPIETLESLLGNADTSVVEAAFNNSFFVHPDVVRERTHWYPNSVRHSKTHYPGRKKGETACWKGKTVKLDVNSRAQEAWVKYTGRLIRKSGYGVRHIWGHPWDPDAFTAGWNLCYMPFWVGMLTEDQHPHVDLQQAIKQASWCLFFADNPVCEPPPFVHDPKFDLAGALRGQSVQVLRKGERVNSGAVSGSKEIEKIIRKIRSERNESWTNLQKAVRSLLGLRHDPFGTKNVENKSKSNIRIMSRQSGVELRELMGILDSMGGSDESET